MQKIMITKVLAVLEEKQKVCFEHPTPLSEEIINIWTEVSLREKKC